MELDKRNFSDFTKFSGSIDSTDGSYKFPSLYHVDHNGNKRIWSIIIRLVKGKVKKYKIDWDVMEDNTIPIKLSYLSGKDITEGTITQVYIETGVISGKITRHPPTYPVITNVGKSNERNTFLQGLVIARSLYLKKIEMGFQTKNKFKSDERKIHKPDKNIKYFPMLVRKYADEKKHLVYPLYVQPKLDGARCVIFLNKSPRQKLTIKNVIMYTRQKKEYLGFDKMREELLQSLIDMWDFEYNESIYIDGELYKHGLSLQDISGGVRNPNRINIKKYNGIKFHAFDVFYPSRLSLDFKNRLNSLDDLFDSLGYDYKCIVKVSTTIAKTEFDQQKLYDEFLSKKYEGIIIRNSDSKYLTHPTKNSRTIRSKFVLKRKMTYSDEFEIVDFTQGKKGRDLGAIIWVCKAHNTDKTFNATPKNITYEERYKLFKSTSVNNNDGFKKKYKGRMMNIEYEDLSNDNIPLRAKAAGFREHI